MGMWQFQKVGDCPMPESWKVIRHPISKAGDREGL
jgi:hypothetical protein